MKKLVLLPIIFFLLVLFSVSVFAQDSSLSPSTNSGSNNCWTKFNGAMNKCLREVTDCNINCGQTSGSDIGRNKVCLGGCSSIYDNCTDQAVVARKACYGIGQQSNQSQQAYTIEIKNFLDQIAQTQQAIDQCAPPRVPSESACVSEILSQFELPIYLKDVAIEPDFTNTIIIDESKVQIISLPEGIKEAPSYLMNSISTNLPNFSEDFKIPATDLEKLPTLNLSPVATTGVILPDQSYTVVESNGLSAVVEPGSKYQDWQPLVTLDKDAVGVGGSAINSVTKMVLASDAKVTLADFPKKSVMEVSNGARVVVAGWAADDTLEAAQDFIGALKN